MKKGTQTNLIEDLKEEKDKWLGVDEKTSQIDIIIERAKKGDYHDLKSGLPIPKVLLHRDCLLIGLNEIAEKSFGGDYDEL